MLIVLPPQKRAEADLAAAGRRGASVGEMRARFRGGRILRRTSPASHDSMSRASSHSAGNLTPVEEETDEEEGSGQVWMRGESRANPVATCRDHSRSAWLHFPHVELVFLFFAFEGAVASHAAVIRDGGCPEIFYTAVAALVSPALVVLTAELVLSCTHDSSWAPAFRYKTNATTIAFFMLSVLPLTCSSRPVVPSDRAMFSVSGVGLFKLLYPVLMFVTVWRTILVRVRPDVLLVFNVYADGDGSNGSRSFLSRFQTSWAEDYSLFSWADKGQWETAQTENRVVSREGDWFRIGFEPVFVDYTKSGTWFVLISLIEVSWQGPVGLHSPRACLYAVVVRDVLDLLPVFSLFVGTVSCTVHQCCYVYSLTVC